MTTTPNNNLAGLKKKGTLFGILLFCAVFLASFPARAEILIYFYDPDANLRDVAQLKSQVQDYFREISPEASLKAFLRLQDLVAAMKSQPPDFLVASSWATKNFIGSFGVKPLLIGQDGAGKSYFKVLISKKNLPDGGNPSISMVGLGEQGSSTLKSLVPELKKFANINLVEVSKDIDAVLAVSFDQVDMALVHPQNIEAVKRANQSATSEIKILSKSSPIEYPIFSATSKADGSLISKFVKALQSMKDAKSAQALNLMGFQGWGVP